MICRIRNDDLKKEEILKWLMGAVPGMVAFHVPDELRCGDRSSRYFKRVNQPVGAPCIVALWSEDGRPRSLLIAIWTQRGSKTNSAYRRQEDCERNGHPYIFVRDLWDVEMWWQQERNK